MSDTPAKSSGSAGTASLLLRVRRPDGKQLEFYLADGLTIGRTVANTIVLIDEDAADRTHARVEFLPDGSARLRCLAPSSRVLVGGTQRAELALTAGVRFQIGRSDFECLPGQRELPPARTVDTTACPFCGTKRLPAQRNVETACTSCQQGILVLQLGPEYPQPVVVPSQYGVYRAERFVARGGMGLVLKGIDGDTSAAVAIKLLHPQRNIDRTSATRFKQEIAMLKRVAHPNVLGLSGYGNVACGLRADGQPNRMSFLVTPWIEGHSLRDVLVDAGRKKQIVAFDQALGWFRQICKGLAAIHAVGIVHRDLKPSNILIGQNGRALIVDLGIAKGPGIPIAITTTGEAPGTSEYMAPEQLLAPNTVDGRADLYSLGITFYEVLTGERPVGAWLPASQNNSSVPDWFDKVLRRLLARAPNDRYADIYDLLAHLNDNPISESMPAPVVEKPLGGSPTIARDKVVQELPPPLATSVLQHDASKARDKDVQERSQLLRSRQTHNMLSMAFGLPAVVLFATAKSGTLSAPMDSVSGAMALLLFCLAGSQYALYKGQNPAWGLLSICSLFLLAFLPDRAKQRLQELDTLPASPSAIADSHQLPKFFWWSVLLPILIYAAPIALMLAIVGWRKQLRDAKPTGWSIFATIWSSLWCLLCGLALIGAISETSTPPKSTRGSSQDPFVATMSSGDYQLTFPQGWQETPELLSTIPGGVLGYSQPQKDIWLVLISDRKRDVLHTSLDNYAEWRKKQILDALEKGSATATTTANIDMHSARSFEVRGAMKQLNVVYVSVVIETADDYCTVRAWTTASGWDEHKNEILSIVDSFSTTTWRR